MAFTQAHALIIGVGSHLYASFADVPITVEDAKAVAEVLQDSKACGYPASQVILLENDKASKNGILSTLREFAGLVKAEDTVFLFYCGHGSLGSDGNYYLVSHDARIKDGRVVPNTGVRESELLEQLRLIQARRVLMVFNACFSGNISPTLGLGDMEFTGLNEDTSAAILGTGEGRIIITACREDQSSYIGDGKLTIFTQALVDGLRGKGVSNRGGFISAYSLYEHIYETVSEVIKEKYNTVQEPELTVLKGIGPFAVALYKGASELGVFDDRQPVPDLPAVRQVKPEKAQKALGNYAQVIGSGTLVQGNNNTVVSEGAQNIGGNADGDVTGGDKTTIQVGDINAGEGGEVNIAGGNISKKEIKTEGGAYIEGGVKVEGGDFVGRDKVTYRDKIGGNQYKIGDFQGASLNIKSALDHVVQSIGVLPHADNLTKAELQKLVSQLNEALKRVPPERAEEAEAVANMTQSIMNTASSEMPNKTMIQITGEGLRRVAKNIADVTPAVLGIVTQIVTTIVKIVG